MRENQAEQKGYRFTGDYGRDKDDMKERAKGYKAKGYKVVVCDVPDSKLSIGGRGTGYSIYAEQKYFIDQEIESINKILSHVDSRKQLALDEYNRKISEIENERVKMEERLKEIASN